MLPLLLASLMLAAPPAQGLSAPPGFEITEYAGSALANDITCMTIDPKGRIVVAGRGYIRVLVDEKDGHATRALDLVKDVKEHAMGLLWEGETLFAVVDGGLWRWHMGKGGTTADGPPQRIRALRAASDHHAHALRRGPDGWLYLLVGDSTGIDEKFATLPTSPIHKPVGGCLIRFSPDFTHSEILADGFRNPYAFDFGPAGDVWTFDSDNERCVSLPWYEPTRVYQVTFGGHHGWRAPQRSETWRCPPYFIDVVPPAATCGRGSPTGVVYHKHTAWPLRQRGLFLADWTFGQIWRFDPHFADKPEAFIKSSGDNGFAPTALCVHPKTGDLFISIGGRGTRGAVYRVHWKDTGAIDFADYNERRETIYNPKTQRFDERIRPPEEVSPKSDYGAEWKDAFLNLLPKRVKAPHTVEDRVRALAEVYRFRDHFPTKVLVDLIHSQWNTSHSPAAKEIADLIAALPPEEVRALTGEAHTPGPRVALALGLVKRDPAAAMDLALSVIELDVAQSRLNDPKLRLQIRDRLNAVRVIQLALGDLTDPAHKAKVWAGYSPAAPLPPDRHPRARAALREAYPSGEADLDRELTRTLAVLEDDDPRTFAKVIAHLGDDSDPLDDIHHLIVLSRLRGPRKPGWTAPIAASLLSLDEKITRLKRNRDRNWPLRVAELHAELARKDANLNSAILNHAEFGRPDHALFTRCPDFDRRAAAEKFVHRAETNASFEWNSELAALLGELPVDAGRPILRKLAIRGGLDDAVLPLLARSARPEDAPLFLAGLTSPQLELVRTCLSALDRSPPPKEEPTALALVRCLRLLPEGKEGDSLRGPAAGLLEHTFGVKAGPGKNAWADWLTRTYPELATRLGGSDGVDVAGWRKRLAKIDWTAGESDRGRAVFAKASCASCHSGSQAMGPDLSGAAGRFSRDDLFTAILQPSKDIAPRYRMTQIETADGRTYQGLIVYEAVDGLILQTGPAQTVRIAGNRIESKRLTDVSLMPVGLLDKLADAEIADLYAFLKSLGRRPEGPGAIR